ncbi:hypothetical protein ACTFIW_002411 [Dictyostelium discoideum]
MFSRFARAFPKILASGASQRTFATVQKAFANPTSKKLIVGSSLLIGSAFATTSFVACENKSVPLVGLPGTNQERSFIAIKPDGTQRRLIGEIIARFEKKGFKLVGIKILVPTPEHAAKHYEDLNKKPFFNGLVKFFSSGAVVAMVFEGKDVVRTGRVLIGATDPSQSAPGTIRFDLCIETGRNIIHGSDSNESAAHEIALWFKEDEIANWVSTNPVYEKM